MPLLLTGLVLISTWVLRVYFKSL